MCWLSVSMASVPRVLNRESLSEVFLGKVGLIKYKKTQFWVCMSLCV